MDVTRSHDPFAPEAVSPPKRAQEPAPDAPAAEPAGSDGQAGDADTAPHTASKRKKAKKAAAHEKSEVR